MRTLCRLIGPVSACALLGAVAPLHASPDAIVLVWQPGGAPSDINQGVQMGIAEAQQTATLLGRSVRLEAHAVHPFAAIVSDADGVSLKAGACTFRLNPSQAQREAVLSEWKKRTGKDGAYHVAVWHPSLRQFGGSDLNERFTRRFHQPMTDEAWLGWVGVKAAVEAALREGGTACAALEHLQFDGHKGASLSFVNGVLRQPLYVVERSAGGERVLAQVPPT